MNKVEFELPKVKLTEDQLVDMISTAMADVCGFDWWKLEKPELYEPTKAKLLAELGDSEDKTICFEQVWARILFEGGNLLLLEAESDWHWKGYPEGTLLWNWQIRASGTEPEGGTWHILNLEKICKGLSIYLSDKGYSSVDRLLSEGDFFELEAVFQCAIYGEVQFG